MSEVWRNVVGCDGRYEISSLGNVRNAKTLRILSPTRVRHGYKAVMLRNNARENRLFLIHRAVLSAFVGLPAEGMQGCHNNGDVDDNRVENLRWDTVTGNNRDKHRHGTMYRGSRHHLAKLDESKVLEIRARAANGETYVSISKSFGINPTTAARAAQGKSCWSRLQVG